MAYYFKNFIYICRVFNLYTLIIRSMKKFCVILLFVLSAQMSNAIPAKRGLWGTFKLTNGTEIKAQLQGDEYLHYWKAADGTCYQVNSDDVASVIADMPTLVSKASKRRNAVNVSRLLKAKSNVAVGGTHTVYSGKKKGLIILTQFSDKKFKSGHDKALYNKIANAEGYNSDGFVGSVRDYFYDQSNGQFELDFDVVGPITLSKTYSYYGANAFNGDDKHPGQMVAEACSAVVDSVNFADYVWEEGSNEISQVFVLYAGQGEADGGSKSTIWPHKWELSSSDYGKPLTLDNVIVNNYACSCELNGNVKLEGVGTICHEFSHCLGLPDMYDTSETSDQKNFGMSSWDLMDYGSYNGDGYVPSAYTSYEKWCAGWLTPKELTTDTLVSSLAPISEKGGAYVIYNDKNKNEYYLLENRQKTGWDKSQSGAGLLILHVDYDADVWANNTVNNVASHQRCTIFHADNSDGYSSNAMTGTDLDLAGDTYPYYDNDSLTNTSIPNALLYNKNTDGSKLMNRNVTKITQNSDGTMSFAFKVVSSTKSKGDTVFYESFDLCTGTGGNDNIWNGTGVATKILVPDNEGWDYFSAYGADKCGKFGSGSVNGTATTPSFTLDGDAVLSFKAAPWGTSDGKTVDVRLNNALLDCYTMTSGQWTEFTIPISGSGLSTIKFIPSKRFFLDEVLIKKATTAGISNVVSEKENVKNGRIYSLCGQYLGTDQSTLKKGIYIINGKKVMK